MEDEFKEVFNDEEIESIITQEGLLSITELFSFFSEALDIAIEWIQHYEPNLSDEEVRMMISDQVTGKSLEEIVDKLAALTEIQESL